jgi:hypothetical protein
MVLGAGSSFSQLIKNKLLTKTVNANEAVLSVFQWMFMILSKFVDLNG